MKTLRQYIGILIAGLLLYFLIKPIVETQAHLRTATDPIQWGWLVCSFGAILFYWGAYIYPFATLLSGLREKHVPFCSAFTLFHLANITRYLPGRIWGIVRLLSLSGQFGVNKIDTASCLTLHVGIETALGGLIAMTLLLSKKMRGSATEVLETFSGDTVLLTLTVMCVLVGGLFSIPKLAKHARAFLKTLAPVLGNVKLWGNVVTCHGLLWLFDILPQLKQWDSLRIRCFSVWIVGYRLRTKSTRSACDRKSYIL